MLKTLIVASAMVAVQGVKLSETQVPAEKVTQTEQDVKRAEGQAEVQKQ